MKSFNFPKPQYVNKEIPKSTMRAFGLPETQEISFVKELVELRKQPPNFVIAESLKNANFTQDHFKEQQLRKKKSGIKPKYVMNLGVYKQLWYDPYRKWKVLRPASLKFKKLYRPYIGQNLDNKTILFTRTGGIGDLLFISPCLRFLKNKYPSCTIKFACGPQYHAMVETWDCIDELLTLPFTVNHLLKSQYHAFFEGVIERCEQAKTINAYHLFSQWLGLDIPDEDLVPIQKPKPELIEEVKEGIDEDERDFIILQLRASSIIRTPRPEIWKKMIEKLVSNGHRIYITDSPHFAPQIDSFIKTLDEHIQRKVINFATYSETLAHSIALTSLAKVAVSTDSSLMHIANSLGIPAFGLYLPFPAKVRLTTYKNVDWVGPKDLKCAPCFLHGGNPCKNSSEGHPNCYDSVDIDECVEKIEALIK